VAQFLSGETQDKIPPGRHQANVTVTATSLETLVRVLNTIQAFENWPGVKIESDAEGLVDTFYGKEKDIWGNP
jgi:hypothetical protein